MNTVTNLIPDFYAALDVVNRELVGVLPGLTLDPQVARAAVGQTVRSPVAPAATATDITPGVTPPDDGDQVIGNVSITISKARRVPVRWNGEQTKGVNSGPGQQNVLRDQFAQAIRTLVNEMEGDATTEARKSASRAYGTAGNTPFATANELLDSSETLRIIEENGGARLQRSIVLNTAAMSNVRGKQAVLFKVNEAGTDDLLRRGVLGLLHGSEARQSAALSLVTKGTGTGYLVNHPTAGTYAVGTTVIAVDTGANTVLVGDIVTFAGDSNKYVVVASDVGGAGTITIGNPGLKQTLANNVAMTIGNSFTPSVMFAKSALVMATRAPALPDGGDSASDRQMIVDPVTGIAFELALYKQYRQIQYEVSAAWGQKGIKQENIAILLG